MGYSKRRIEHKKSANRRPKNCAIPGKARERDHHKVKTHSTRRTGQAVGSDRSAGGEKITKNTILRDDILKAEIEVALAGERKLKIGKFATPDRGEIVWMQDGSRLATMPLVSWHGSGSQASRAIATQGIAIIGKDLGLVRNAVASLARLSEVPVVTRGGWSPYGFALMSADVVGPKGKPIPISVFDSSSNPVNRAGTLEGWRDIVAAPLSASPIASFFLTVPFLGPVQRLTSRRGIFAFELVGHAGSGHEAMMRLMRSIVGDPMGVDQRAISLTSAQLADVVAEHNDLPLLLGAADIVGRGGARRTRPMTVFEATAKLLATHAAERQPTTPCLVAAWATGERTVARLGIRHAAEMDAMCESVMAVGLPDDPAHPLFNVPADSNVQSFTEALERASRDHHGHALRAFVEWLVERRALDGEGLERKISEKVAKTAKSLKPKPENASETRVREAFALVCVVGGMLKAAGVLPKSFKGMAAAKAAYALHRQTARPAISFEEKLKALIRDPNTVDLAKMDAEDLTVEQRSRCRAYLDTRRDGREVIIPLKQRDEVFTDWNRERHQPELLRRLKPYDGEHNVNRRKLGPGKKKSAYVFDITGLED